MQLHIFLGILSDTGNLTLATTNVTATTAMLTGAPPGGVADPSAHVGLDPKSQYVDATPPGASAAMSRPGISFNTRFNAVLDPTPVAGSHLDLATEGYTHRSAPKDQ